MNSPRRRSIHLVGAVLAGLLLSCVPRYEDVGECSDAGEPARVESRCGDWGSENGIQVAKPCGESSGTSCDAYRQELAESQSEGCPTETACYPEATGIGDCYPAGSRSEGAPCTAANDCAPTLTCARLPSTGYQCMPLCEAGSEPDGGLGSKLASCWGLNPTTGVVVPENFDSLVPAHDGVAAKIFVAHYAGLHLSLDSQDTMMEFVPKYLQTCSYPPNEEPSEYRVELSLYRDGNGPYEVVDPLPDCTPTDAGSIPFRCFGDRATATLSINGGPKIPGSGVILLTNWEFFYPYTSLGKVDVIFGSPEQAYRLVGTISGRLCTLE